MTRKKVKLVWIANDSARKASFKKRRLGLVKKVRELTTLCGIYAFAIIYGPDDEHPIIWPSLSAAQHLYRRFLGFSVVERQKKMTDQESYLKERTAKTQELLKKAMKKNHQLQIHILMNQLKAGRPITQLSTADLLGLLWTMEDRMARCRKRIQYHHQLNRLHATPPFVSSNTGPNATADLLLNGPTLVNQWFVDMVKDTDDQIGGSGCAVGAGRELPFFQPEENLDRSINGGVNARMENNLLLEWNFDRSSSGMNELEKLVNGINAGMEKNARPVDMAHHRGTYGTGGDHTSRYPNEGSFRGEIGGNYEAQMMMFNGFNEDVDQYLSNHWSNYVAP